MKKALPLLLGLLMAMPGTASAVGELEYDFGRGGKVLTPVSLRGPWSEGSVHLDQAPDGGILVGGAEEVVRYLPSGDLDRSFANRGLLPIVLPRVSRFEIADLDVDSQGRIVIAGTATGVGSGGAVRTLAALLRYLPEGEPDLGFGDDGAVTTDLGLRLRDGRAASAVAASFAAVDRRNRILLVAGAVERSGACGEPPNPRRRHRVVARFTAHGELDRTFGGGRGSVNVYPLQAVSDVSFDRGDGLVLAGPIARTCSRGRETAVLRLRAGGARKRSFGVGGVERLTGRPAALALDRRDRVTILFKEKLNPRRRNEHFFKVARLLSNGRRDRSFDENGLIGWGLEGPLYKWSKLLVAPDGHLLLVGTLVRPLPKKKQHDGVLFHRWLMVLPLTEDGQEVHGFGFLGWLTITRFGGSGDAAATDALIDQDGELLMAGTGRTPEVPRGGFALARFELWR